MRTKFIGLFIACGVIVASAGCKKYEEGGLIGKTEKNIKETWKLQKYLRNSVDETSLLLIRNYEETYSDDGIYTRSYIDEDGETVSEAGKWGFDKKQERVNISGVSSIDLTDETGTVSSAYYNILKLKDDELWYYFTNGGDKHEFHLIKK